MRLDCPAFEMALNTLKEKLWMIAERDSPAIAVQIISISTHIPMAVVVLFCMKDDMFGKIPELERMLKTLIDFYKYDEIIPFEVPNG